MIAFGGRIENKEKFKHKEIMQKLLCKSSVKRFNAKTQRHKGAKEDKNRFFSLRLCAFASLR